MSDKPQRRVVCAACRNIETGEIILGPRHFDETMRSHLKDKKQSHLLYKDQGFIDQWGVYMDRKEAHIVAKAAGQIVRRCGGDDDTLYSENLY